MTVDLCMAYNISAHARFDDLDLVIVGRQRQKFSIELSRQLSKQHEQARIKLATTVE